MKRFLPVWLAALPAACATPNSAPLSPVIYNAVGTEPFWSLTIDQRSLSFTLAGAQPVEQPTPKVIVGIAGEIYRTRRIDVNIVHAQCSDGMSDRTYPDKVQVRVDEHHFTGCGGL